MSTALVPSSNNTAMIPMGDLERMAMAIAKSGLFGLDTPEKALSLMLVAQAEGCHPAIAARDYHIVHNRPAKKSEAMLRDFFSAGGKVEWHVLDDTVADATFSHPAGGAVRINWDLNRAKKAEVTKNTMWSKYPRQMLRSRCISEGVRTVFPGATSGMYVAEEVADIPINCSAVFSGRQPKGPVNVVPADAKFVSNPNSLEEPRRTKLVEQVKPQAPATSDKLEAETVVEFIDLIESSETMVELKANYGKAYVAAKTAKDDEAMAKFEEVKESMKAKLADKAATPKRTKALVQQTGQQSGGQRQAATAAQSTSDDIIDAEVVDRDADMDQRVADDDGGVI